MNGNSGAGPRVAVRLPDQQTVLAVLCEQWQGVSGQWFCDVEVHVWAHTQGRTGQDTAEPAPVRFSVPAPQVSRVPGVSYSGVPTRRHPRFTQPPADRWRIEDLGLQPGTSGGAPLRFVHHMSCWISPGPNDLSTAQARAALRGPDTAACPHCDAKRLVQQL